MGAKLTTLNYGMGARVTTLNYAMQAAVTTLFCWTGSTESTID